MMLARQITPIVYRVHRDLQGFGRFTSFTLSAAGWTIRGAGGYGRMKLLIPQLFQVGTLSIPVVALVGAFVGAVLGVEMFAQFQAFGQETRLGGVIHISVVKQIGPVLAAVMIAGRVGGAVSAEIGSMRVTEQLDALRVMGSDPVRHLVVPRVLACLIMVPILTVFSDLLGIFGSWLVVVQGFGVDSNEYWKFSGQFVGNWDIFTGLVKSVVFGLGIGLISCYKGFNCGTGASGVGRAATDSFVVSFIAIIVANFFLAMFMNDMYDVFYGSGAFSAVG
jgi:phospholipid/cholesterol/gamma-HCH transport system permease protein